MSAVFKALMGFLPQADIIYVVLFLGVAGVGGYYVHKYHAAINFETTVKAESAATLATATKTLAAENADYKAKLAAEKLDHANDTLAALQQHNDDIARLRPAAPHQTNTVLRGTSSPAAGTPSGANSAESMGGLSQHAVVCQGLADALRADDDIIAAERAERDALTGK